MNDNESRVQLDEILPRVYDDLRRFASRALQRESDSNSFQTTELVHEAYLRLAGINQIQWDDPDQLLRAAVGVMRRVLIDYARSRKSLKRNAKQAALRSPSGDFGEAVHDIPGIDLLALDEALERLQAFDERKAEIVELHFFGGQDFETVARLVEVSQSTVKRDWALAKAWLLRELHGPPE